MRQQKKRWKSLPRRHTSKSNQFQQQHDQPRASRRDRQEDRLQQRGGHKQGHAQKMKIFARNDVFHLQRRCRRRPAAREEEGEAPVEKQPEAIWFTVGRARAENKPKQPRNWILPHNMGLCMYKMQYVQLQIKHSMSTNKQTNKRKTK